ncbi:MAG: radical SAM protein [Bacteroidales bacterium]
MYFNTRTYRKIIRLKQRWLWNQLAFPFISSKNKNKPAIRKYIFSRVTGPNPVVCHAPYRSVYFGFNGKVQPCCFNREHLYGKYPEQSVDSILHGAKRKELQQALDNQDFSFGCKHCLELINAGNYEGVEARLYDGLKINKNWHPSEMIFELDNTCNLECVMCEGRFSSAILKNREHKIYKPGPYDDKFVEQIKPHLSKLEVAKFMGGEPFLINIHYKIWDAILEVNPRCIINLQTNGTVFNQKIASLLKRGRFQIGVSIDSLEKEKFETIRKNAVFENVMDNVDKFIAVGKRSGHHINVSVCPMQQNRYEIPDLVRFCNDKKVFVYFNTVYTEGFNLRELVASELESLLLFYQQSLETLQHTSFIHRRNHKLFKSLITQIHAWWKKTKTEEEQYLKNQNTSRADLHALLAAKLGDTPNAHDKLAIIINKLPDNVMFSKHQLLQLTNIQEEDFIRELENNDVDTLINKFNYFIDNQTFPRE